VNAQSMPNTCKSKELFFIKLVLAHW